MFVLNVHDIVSDQLTVSFGSGTVRSAGLTWFTMALTVTVIWKAAVEMICHDLSFRGIALDELSL